LPNTISGISGAAPHILWLNFLDTQDAVSYTADNEKQVLINSIYIIRASFSQERMTYLPVESRIIYRSKDNRKEKTFDALDWLAAMTSHIPNQREQMVRYYGFYSNVSRGLRKKK